METFQQTGATQLSGDQTLKDYFLGGSFNRSSSFGSIDSSVFGDYGAEASMSLSGRAGLDFDFTGTGGTVNSTYNATLNQSFTDPTGFGQMVTFSPSNTSVAFTSGKFSTTSPSFGYGASADLSLNGNIGGQFAVVSSFGGNFSFGGSLDFPFMSVNEDNDGIAELMGIPFVGASPGFDLNSTLQALIGGIENFASSYDAYIGLSNAPPPPTRLKLNLSTLPGQQLSQDMQLQFGLLPQKLGPYTVPKALNFTPNAGIDLASMTEGAPTVAPSSSTLQAGGLLGATDKGTVAQLNIQLGPLASLLLGQSPALSSTDSINLGPISVSFTPVSFQLQPTLYAVQTVSIQPLSLLTYNFSVPAGDALPAVTLDGKLLQKGQGVSSVTFTPGKDTVGIAFEGYPITVTPSWDFQEIYNDQVTLNADLGATLTVGELSVSVPGLGSYTFGPLYQQHFNFADTPLETLVNNQSSTIYNQPFALPSFTIGSNFQLTTAVTTTNDSNQEGSGSLRYAILSANRLSALNPSDPVVIQVPAGTYDLTIPSDGLTDGSTGNLLVTGPNLIIMGNGYLNTTINAYGLGDRVFNVKKGANVELVGLSIISGLAANYNDPNVGVYGGGISQDSGSTLTLDSCSVGNNQATAGGGGIFSEGNLIIIDSAVDGNYSDGGDTNSGGGILIQNGSLVLQDSLVYANTVFFSVNCYGGGVSAFDSSVTIESSTFWANGVTAGAPNGGAIGQANGGGLDFYDLNAGGNLLVVNSTFYGNGAFSSAGEGGGGGMYIYIGGSEYAYLVNDTVDGNSASNYDSGILALPYLVMKNTVVADNDMFGTTVYSAGNNLIDNTAQGLASVPAMHNLTFSSTGVPTASASGFDPTDKTNINPQLGSIGVISGPPWPTLVPQPGSPVIGAGGNTFSVPSVLSQIPSTDERGLARSVNGSTDIGAVEYQYDLDVSGSQSLANGTLTYSLQVANNGPDPAGGVTLTDVLPSGLTFVSATGPASGWTVSNPAVGSSGTVTFTSNSGSLLSSGQSASFTIVAQLTPLQPVNNPITLSPTASDANLGNNQLTLSVYSEGQPFTNAVLFYFASPNPDYTAADFTATANWGDSTSNTSSDGKGNVAVVAAPRVNSSNLL
jgi:uncharacterized repeat protein (TIGR01451 family)